MLIPRLLRSATTAAVFPLTAAAAPPRRTYIADQCASGFDENLLRILRSELTYLSDYYPPSPPPSVFRSFWLDHRFGHQWARLRSQHGGGREDVKVDATMFDGAASISGLADDVRLHISLVVEVSKGEGAESVLQFSCSAWPDSLEVQKVFPLHRRRDNAPFVPYMGRELKKLDVKMQDAVYGYLEERGVDDELAGFLHEYMANKDNAELIRWLGTVESYVQK